MSRDPVRRAILLEDCTTPERQTDRLVVLTERKTTDGRGPEHLECIEQRDHELVAPQFTGEAKKSQRRVFFSGGEDWSLRAKKSVRLPRA